MLPKITNERPERNCKGVTVGIKNQLLERQARLDVCSSTFFYATPKIWNSNITPTHVFEGPLEIANIRFWGFRL